MAAQSPSAHVQPVVRSVRDGVFFTLPTALPRGRHKLSRDQVGAAQSERILVAATELLAAHGYLGFKPVDIATRAGVSLAAFYNCFPNKDACLFAGYDHFIDVLLTRLTALDTAGKDPGSLAVECIADYLNVLDNDPVVARAYLVEIDSLAAAARTRRRNSLEMFAAFLFDRIEGAYGGHMPGHISRTVVLGLIYAVRQLVSDILDGPANPDVPSLLPQLEPWIRDMLTLR